MASTKGTTPVQNLQRIWTQKKVEMDLTQVEAAAQLNWTQGAFSQYLNDITEMSSATVIKLANFFGVDPEDIDPDIILPSVQTIACKFEISDPTSKKKRKVDIDTGDDLFLIEVDHKGFNLPIGSYVEVVDVLVAAHPRTRSTTNTPWYLYQVKGGTQFKMSKKSDVSPPADLEKKFLITGIWLY